MNGLHDMGGQHCYGPVLPEADEPLFHAPWERRALALTLAMGAHGKWTLDQSRSARESLEPHWQINASYYERWIEALTRLMMTHGLISEAELTARAPQTPRGTPALMKDDVAAVLARGGPVDRPLDDPPRFSVGDAVLTRNINPATHTRLPAYARAKAGTIVRHHGAHVFADASAAGTPRPAHLYAVRFTARALWGEDAPRRDSVTLDLWEPYLERA